MECAPRCSAAALGAAPDGPEAEIGGIDFGGGGQRDGRHLGQMEAGYHRVFAAQAQRPHQLQLQTAPRGRRADLLHHGGGVNPLRVKAVVMAGRDIAPHQSVVVLGQVVLRRKHHARLADSAREHALEA